MSSRVFRFSFPVDPQDIIDLISKQQLVVLLAFRASELPKGTYFVASEKYMQPVSARDARMIGRTIKTAGITVLRGDAFRGSDWWVCERSCGREFMAHGWGGRHGHTRHCGSEEHKVQPIGHRVAAFAM